VPPPKRMAFHYRQSTQTRLARAGAVFHPSDAFDAGGNVRKGEVGEPLCVAPTRGVHSDREPVTDVRPGIEESFWMTRPDAAVVNACGGLVPLPRSRRRTGSSCTSNDSWFGAAKTVTVELAQECRTLLLDRAIEASSIRTPSSRSARLPRAHGALCRSRADGLGATTLTPVQIYTPENA
jgi:hypothetical protein